LEVRVAGVQAGDLTHLWARNPMYDAVIDEVDGRRIRIGGDWLVDFASCNYLGFDLEPEIMTAIDAAIRRWGTHPGWSRLLGNPRLYIDIEERLTELLGAPDVLVLPTISHIHFSVIAALAQHGTVFVERRAHKTVYDGAVYARGLGATLLRFRADDPEGLEAALRTAARPAVVCLDGVDSMTGNAPNLALLQAICVRRGALLYVDDAHGFGVVGERRPDERSPYGSRGNAILRHQGVSHDNVVLVGGLSKAYSSLLAFVAVPTPVKQHLKVAAPPYLYTGPSPTASLAGVLAGLDVNAARGDDLRATLHRLTRRVLDHVRKVGLRTPNRLGTPIVELPLGAGADLDAVTRLLWRCGVYVTVAAYPLVPRAEAGVRIQVTAAHTDEHIDRLLDALTELASLVRGHP
jgi:8-amino-7-oxononanoate synthase